MLDNFTKMNYNTTTIFTKMKKNEHKRGGDKLESKAADAKQMVVMKIKLYKDSAGALHAEFLDGLNSVSQNNSNVNGVLVVLDNFDLMPEEVLRIAYELESGAEVDDYTLMEDNGDGTYSAEVPPAVTRSDVGTEWFLGLQIASNWVENDDYTGYLYKQNLVERLKFTVNNAVRDLNGKYPSRGDLTALYQEAQAKIEKEEKNAETIESLQNEMPLVAKSVLYSSDFFSSNGEEMYVSIGKFNRTPIIGEEVVVIVQGDKSSYIVHYRVLELDGDHAVCKLIGSEQLGVDEERFSSVEAIAQQNTSDIEGLRQDIINESHFRGYLLTNAEVQALDGNANDYAYSAESGTKWIFHPAPMRWIDSGVPVPDQSVPASDATPLMDGEPSAGQEGAYARADHRHPSDTSKVNKAGDEMTGPLTIGEKWPDGITFKEYLKLQKDGIEIGHTGEAEYAGVTRKKIYTKDVAITGEGIALSIHDDSVYGEDRVLHFPEPRIHWAEESDPYTYYYDETLAALSDIEPIEKKLVELEEKSSDIPENIEDGSGNGAIQQVADGSVVIEYSWDFTGRNANAEADDPSLSGPQPYGGVGKFSATFGGINSAQGGRSFAVNNKTIAKGDESFAQGYCSVAAGPSSFAGGTTTYAKGEASVALGALTQALADYAVALGSQTKSSGVASFAGGVLSYALGYASFSYGNGSEATGESSWATGDHTLAEGKYSYATGYGSKALGQSSFAEGWNTEAIGDGSHAQGSSTRAIGPSSHAGGVKTIAGYEAQTVIGRFNDNKEENIFEVGNGDAATGRSNAFEVRKDGSAAYVGAKKLAIEEDLPLEYKGGVLKITQAEAPLSGYMFTLDYSTFNRKPRLGEVFYNIVKHVPKDQTAVAELTIQFLNDDNSTCQVLVGAYDDISTKIVNQYSSSGTGTGLYYHVYNQQMTPEWSVAVQILSKRSTPYTNKQQLLQSAINAEILAIGVPSLNVSSVFIDAANEQFLYLNGTSVSQFGSIPNDFYTTM